jgi:predicted dehydrogenase
MPIPPFDFPRRLRTAVVGCRGMGTHHAHQFASLPEYQLVAFCDLQPEQTAPLAAAFPAGKAYSDYAQMLREAELDVVVVATGTSLHHAMVMQAAQTPGVKIIYCEKPMSVSYGQAKEMVQICAEKKITLAVNHQRRCMPVFTTMRRLMDEGAIGKPLYIVGSNAGDILSDGTHFIDTVRHLAGDSDLKWVLGQIYRAKPNPEEAKGGGFKASGGWRYGHPVETGAFAVMEFANGLRAEVHSGKLIMPNRHYQHYEVIGTEGRLLRPNDNGVPNLLIQDNQAGGYRAVELDPLPDLGMAAPTLMTVIFRELARSYWHGTPHPLSGASALKDQELVMAIYESARTHQLITPPLQQDRYPLEIMIEEGIL